MDLEVFKTEIMAADPLLFCRKSLFNNSSWLFENAAANNLIGDYADFKFVVGNYVDTSPNNIAIVGSSKFGFSMSPLKNYRAFDSSSDLDLVIVSPELFQRTWDQFRAAIYSGYTWVQGKHASEIIRRYIILSGAEQYESSKYLRETALMMVDLRKTISSTFQITQEIKYRIYASWVDAEAYHVHGVSILRSQLEKANAQ